MNISKTKIMLKLLLLISLFTIFVKPSSASPQLPDFFCEK